MKVIMHVDFNSYFATVEQQANPRLRGKPIGVTGGDRIKRTVLSAASVEAKRLGIRTGMQIWEARKIYPELIMVVGDSDKYLACTTRFINILKDYTPFLEVFSIDEAFLELPNSSYSQALDVAKQIKLKIKNQLGEWITCSIGVSYNKTMAKLAGSLQKPDGLTVIESPEVAIQTLDKIELDDICGIGSKTKRKLFNMGITGFKSLRQVPKQLLRASFKSYGETLYNYSRGVDYSEVKPFYEKAEVKSIGHRHTIDHDVWDPNEIRQVLLKISEMIAQRARAKKLVGQTVSCWYRSALFEGDGMQKTLGRLSADGLEIFNAAWGCFWQVWDQRKIRMIGASLSHLQPINPHNLSWLPDDNKRDRILTTLDNINNRFGDFTLQRAVLLGTSSIKRKPNPFLSDRRFKGIIRKP